MALGSRHYKALEAIRSSIIADSDIIAVIPAAQWRVQKKPWHRTQSWDEGGTIAPLRKIVRAFENRKLRYVLPCIVAIAFPSDGALRAGQEQRMGVMERIEDLFNFQGPSTAPAPLLTLDSALSGVNDFTFQQTTIDPGELFIDGALQNGLDALAVVVNVDILACKNDHSSLGA